MANKVKKSRPIALTPLTAREGFYSGFGTNHENKEFKGMLELKSVVDNKGVYIIYKAIGVEGEEFNTDSTLYNKETVLYNEESTLICNDTNNELSLFTLNNNIGTMIKFDLRRYKQFTPKRHLYIFGYGNPEDNNVFREEIALELHENGDISYNYSWGEAGGLFLERSSVTMKKLH